jgi:bifunctional DNA-binding transcriptional regulator/antitoxin component of YhaV-PrlF toxin-antitoxin module
MTTIHYRAKVEPNGSLMLPRKAQEALNLQPGDEIEIHIEDETTEKEREELRQALDIGIEQLEQGESSVYTQDTIQELTDEVRAEGQKRLAQARQKRAS